MDVAPAEILHNANSAEMEDMDEETEMLYAQAVAQSIEDEEEGDDDGGDGGDENNLGLPGKMQAAHVCTTFLAQSSGCKLKRPLKR